MTPSRLTLRPIVVPSVSPSASMPDGPALRAKLAKLKIYSIGIEDSLVLDWSFGMGDQDEHYLRYCPVEPLLLPPSTDEYHSYADLYDL